MTTYTVIRTLPEDALESCQLTVPEEYWWDCAYISIVPPDNLYMPVDVVAAASPWTVPPCEDPTVTLGPLEDIWCNHSWVPDDDLLDALEAALDATLNVDRCPLYRSRWPIVRPNLRFYPKALTPNADGGAGLADDWVVLGDHLIPILDDYPDIAADILIEELMHSAGEEHGPQPGQTGHDPSEWAGFHIIRVVCQNSYPSQ